MNDVMIDIETLDTSASAVILSIGAVRFDIANPDQIISMCPTFHERIDIDSSLAQGRTVSGSTITWWMDQDNAARKKITAHDGIELFAALNRLSQFIKEDDRVWGNGAAFDNSILSDAYKSCGLDQPWRFWNDMCYRTLKALFKKQVPQPKFEGTEHDALDDAIHQARHLQQIYKHINQ